LHRAANRVPRGAAYGLSVDGNAIAGLARIQDHDCVDDPLPPNHPVGLAARETSGSLESSLSRRLGTVAFHHEKRGPPYFGLDRHDELTPQQGRGLPVLRDQRVAKPQFGARID
jgi:hypothetical protein